MSVDLSLASACLDGDAKAWETFLSQYRSLVFASALRLARNESVAREIADSIWAELYGKRKLAGYSGRGSLEGWLRTLVAQAYVDRHRKERRFVPFDEPTPASYAAEAEVATEVTVDARLEQALDRALAELSAEQRLILSAHYLDGRTFVEIGRMVGAHESSVSRQSNKSLAFVRKRTAHHLRLAGLSVREAQQAMAGDVRGISLDVRKRLQLAKNTP